MQNFNDVPNATTAPCFEQFLEASSLHAHNSRPFADRVQTYVPTQHLRSLTVSAPDQPLYRMDDPLARIASQRSSVRSFANEPISFESLGSLLQGFACEPDGSRSFPSAGGIYPFEALVALANVKGMPRQLAVYHPDTHALATLDTLVDWSVWSAILGSGVLQEPPVTVFICVHMNDLVSKYGERGGRFAFLEAGHAGQMLALRAIAAGLGGYAVGGALDDSVLNVFGLASRSDPLIVTLAYVFGVPESTTPEPRKIVSPNSGSSTVKARKTVQDKWAGRRKRWSAKK
jgi:SagB-type dehydrogenase family enzyme